MRNPKGQFIKGHRPSRATEFKKGNHWREPKPYWDRDWLYTEYVTKERSAADIATEFGCYDNNILYFLHKHGIPRRSISEARDVKHWGMSGPDNWMHGRTGEESPNWKGGCTPERQAVYSSLEWGEASKGVWARDKGTCQRCEKLANDGGKFHIHHIVSFAVEELRTELSNLVLLCIDCHHFVHSRANTEREYISDH